MAGPANPPIWSCSERGLPSRLRRRNRWWALTPPFHPYPANGAVCFLWHYPGITPPGGYPAFCPAEPGLSSPALADRSDGLSDSIKIISKTRKGKKKFQLLFGLFSFLAGNMILPENQALAIGTGHDLLALLQLVVVLWGYHDIATGAYALGHGHYDGIFHA